MRLKKSERFFFRENVKYEFTFTSTKEVWQVTVHSRNPCEYRMIAEIKMNTYVGDTLEI